MNRPLKARFQDSQFAQASTFGPASAERPPMRRQRLAVATQRRVAVLVPCYNEAVTIADVVADFRRALPAAKIHVYDNNSSDGTGDIARRAGAVVRVETFQGKGNVVRRMFSDIDADVYVLVDGDGTYTASDAPAMVQLLLDESLDCVNAVRRSTAAAAYRPGHRLGNRVLTGLVAHLFGSSTGDMLTGYRVFSRRFVKSFPMLAHGFEIETEMTVHALEMRMRSQDFDSRYVERPEGSVSKLNTYRDGLRILKVIVGLIKQEKPLLFFSTIATIELLVAIGLFIPVLMTYLHTGQVPRLPTAILSASLGIVAVLSAACGLILDTVTRGRKEIKRLFYLQLAPASSDASGDAATARAA